MKKRSAAHERDEIKRGEGGRVERRAGEGAGWRGKSNAG